MIKKREMNAKTKRFNPAVSILIPIAIFLTGLLVNMVAVKRGFPLLIHPDEPLVVEPIVRMVADKTLNPHSFVRPNLFIIYLGYFYISAVGHLLKGMDLPLLYRLDPRFIYSHGRLLVCVLGAFVPLFAYFIGKEIKGLRLGNFFAIVCSFYPTLVVHSHQLTADIPIAALLMGTIYFALKYLKTHKFAFLLFATVLTALALLEKYSALPFTATIIIALWIRYFFGSAQTRSKKWSVFFKKGLICFGVFLLILVIVGNSLFLEIPRVIASITQEARPDHIGADGLGFFGNLWYYLKTFALNTNPLIWFFALLGIVVAIKEKCKYCLLFLVGALNWILISAFGLHWERWSLPMVIAPLFFSAYGLDFLLTWWRERKALNVLSVLMASLALVLAFLNGIYFAVIQAWPDSRAVALDFVEKNGITSENSFDDGYTPFVPAAYMRNFGDYSGDSINEKEFLVLSSYSNARFKVDPAKHQKELSFYEAIKSRSTLLKKFDGDVEAKGLIDRTRIVWEYIVWTLRGKRDTKYFSGPIIDIYKVNH